MPPAELYSRYFNHGMLLVVLLTALVYSSGRDKAESSAGYSTFMLWALGGIIIFFIGTRPISGAFVDMTTYAFDFNVVQHKGASPQTPDWGFNLLTDFCAGTMDVEQYFLVCTLLYVVPLMLGMRWAHKSWAFAGFLALAGGFSFFAYGVNGIRNGISTSLVIAAFAFSDKKLLMILLMVAAEGMHKSALLPIISFFVAGFYAQPRAYAVIWSGAFALSLVAGERLSHMLVGSTILGADDRLSHYAELGNQLSAYGGDKGGFRLDFVLYSIVPVAISYHLASAATRADAFYRRLLCTYLLANSFWLLAMYAAFSNRFAYLSWFMMPWVVLYPFIPRDAMAGGPRAIQEGPRFGLLAAALVAHFSFTYIMIVFVYPNRGG